MGPVAAVTAGCPGEPWVGDPEGGAVEVVLAGCPGEPRAVVAEGGAVAGPSAG
jgi:hypothetical protein